MKMTTPWHHGVAGQGPGYQGGGTIRTTTLLHWSGALLLRRRSSSAAWATLQVRCSTSNASIAHIQHGRKPPSHRSSSPAQKNSIFSPKYVGGHLQTDVGINPCSINQGYNKKLSRGNLGAVARQKLNLSKVNLVA